MEVLMMLRMAMLAGAMLVATSGEASAQKIYRCLIEDGVYRDGGKFVRNDFMRSRAGNFSPIIVDTASGIMRLGNAKPAQWVIAQRATSGGFFIATMHAIPGAANDRFTLLHQLTPIEFVYYYETSMVFSGTCDVMG